MNNGIHSDSWECAYDCMKLNRRIDQTWRSTRTIQSCKLPFTISVMPFVSAFVTPNISQSILHPLLRNRGQGPHSFCSAKTPYHTSNQDASLQAKKLPCLRTGRVELSARWHYKSRTDTGAFQDWMENSPVSWGICLAALIAPMWLG